MRSRRAVRSPRAPLRAQISTCGADAIAVYAADKILHTLPPRPDLLDG